MCTHKEWPGSQCTSILSTVEWEPWGRRWCYRREPLDELFIYKYFKVIESLILIITSNLTCKVYFVEHTDSVSTNNPDKLD